MSDYWMQMIHLSIWSKLQTSYRIVGLGLLIWWMPQCTLLQYTLCSQLIWETNNLPFYNQSKFTGSPTNEYSCCSQGNSRSAPKLYFLQINAPYHFFFCKLSYLITLILQLLYNFFLQTTFLIAISHTVFCKLFLQAVMHNPFWFCKFPNRILISFFVITITNFLHIVMRDQCFCKLS